MSFKSLSGINCPSKKPETIAHALGLLAYFWTIKYVAKSWPFL